MKTLIMSVMLSLGLAFISAQVAALDFDKALERASNLPKKPPIDAGTSPGLVEKSDDMQRQFMRQDDADTARAKANRPNGGAPAPCYSSSKDCFSVVKSSSGGGRVTIRCEKGTSYKIGQEREICRGDSGKWATGCGFSDTFAHHYTFTEAGNKACD